MRGDTARGDTARAGIVCVTTVHVDTVHVDTVSVDTVYVEPCPPASSPNRGQRLVQNPDRSVRLLARKHQRR